VSIVSVSTGLYAIRRASGIVGAPLRELSRSLWGLVLAGLVALGAAFLVDATALSDHPGRVDAALQAGVDALVMAAAYLAALRVLAPAQLARLVGAIGRLRRKDVS